jgi:hypothetical protein
VLSSGGNAVDAAVATLFARFSCIGVGLQSDNDRLPRDCRSPQDLLTESHRFGQPVPGPGKDQPLRH